MNHRRVTLVAAATAALTFALVHPVAAQSAARKAGRGLAAMTTGFLEVPGNMVRETDHHGAAEGVPLGFARGLGMIVVRELVGVYELVSSPIPAPRNFEPIIRPEYPWDYFDRSRASYPHDDDRADASHFKGGRSSDRVAAWRPSPVDAR
jgi:putative exosortase-associated protein (TIGR04073 family)